MDLIKHGQKHLIAVELIYVCDHVGRAGWAGVTRGDVVVVELETFYLAGKFHIQLFVAFRTHIKIKSGLNSEIGHKVICWLGAAKVGLPVRNEAMKIDKRCILSAEISFDTSEDGIMLLFRNNECLE